MISEIFNNDQQLIGKVRDIVSIPESKIIENKNSPKPAFIIAQKDQQSFRKSATAVLHDENEEDMIPSEFSENRNSI